MFFYMSLAMCNSRIVCDVICRHFFTFLPISIPGYWEIRCCWFFPLSLRPVHKIKFERNAKISNILYREKTLNLIDQCYYYCFCFVINQMKWPPLICVEWRRSITIVPCFVLSLEMFIAEVFYLLTHFLHCDKNVAK